MDWKAFIMTFGLVFFAELGDKTQLATMTLAAQSKQFWPVLLGSSLALVSSSLLAVLFGAAIVQVVPARLIHIGSGIAFIAIGALLLSGRL